MQIKISKKNGLEVDISEGEAFFMFWLFVMLLAFGSMFVGHH